MIWNPLNWNRDQSEVLLIGHSFSLFWGPLIKVMFKRWNYENEIWGRCLIVLLFLRLRFKVFYKTDSEGIVPKALTILSIHALEVAKCVLSWDREHRSLKIACTLSVSMKTPEVILIVLRSKRRLRFTRVWIYRYLKLL